MAKLPGIFSLPIVVYMEILVWTALSSLALYCTVQCAIQVFEFPPHFAQLVYFMHWTTCITVLICGPLRFSPFRGRHWLLKPLVRGFKMIGVGVLFCLLGHSLVNGMAIVTLGLFSTYGLCMSQMVSAGEVFDFIHPTLESGLHISLKHLDLVATIIYSFYCVLILIVQEYLAYVRRTGGFGGRGGGHDDDDDDDDDRRGRLRRRHGGRVRKDEQDEHINRSDDTRVQVVVDAIPFVEKVAASTSADMPFIEKRKNITDVSMKGVDEGYSKGKARAVAVAEKIKKSKKKQILPLEGTHEKRLQSSLIQLNNKWSLLERVDEDGNLKQKATTVAPVRKRQIHPVEVPRLMDTSVW
ncbi:uncharacterized protein LOC132314983 [Cornus florida]|uniref:uncharacterized protein LOC132314983 n=1 Tax=Cornus florida TaxID=4283 RepID=UPI00289B30F2|nr:uncharacterized protein LOC132314983 [Cornus florida]